MKIVLLTGIFPCLECAYAKHIGAIFPESNEIWALIRCADRLAALIHGVCMQLLQRSNCPHDQSNTFYAGTAAMHREST